MMTAKKKLRMEPLRGKDAPSAKPSENGQQPPSVSLLEVDDIHVRYGVVPALRGVSLEVKEGEMVSLLGANGAGKTTTLRAISGMVAPHQGAINLSGKKIHGLSPPQVVSLGVSQMPEGRDLFPQLSVQENLRYAYWPRRKDKKGFKPQLQEVFELFPRLKERSSQKAATLSGGEQQMLTAGMALMSRPRLMLVDELSLGLAPKIVTLLFEALARVNREHGTAILLVEQFVPLALANTKRAYVLSKGEVVLEGKSSKLKDDPALLESYMGGAVPAE